MKARAVLPNIQSKKILLSRDNFKFHKVTRRLGLRKLLGELPSLLLLLLLLLLLDTKKGNAFTIGKEFKRLVSE